MTSMPSGRQDHSCGLVIHPENGPEIIVAGGYPGLDTVDIYVINSDYWFDSNPLPKSIYGASVVPFHDDSLLPFINSFYLVGGYSDGYLADIYMYRPGDDDDWIKLETELKTSRKGHVALLVQQSLFPDC